MSSREAAWYCHECHSETHPLMVPDPHCERCHSDFVEMIENAADDPRAPQAPPFGDYGDDTFPPDVDSFFAATRALLGAFAPHPPREADPARASSRQRTQSMGGSPRSGPGEPSGSGMTIRISGSPGGGHTMIIGGGGGGGGGGGSRSGRGPRLAGDGEMPGDGGMPGELMTRYLLAMLASQGRGEGRARLTEIMGGLFPMAEGAENGRWGDYVYNQEALDQIITHIMETSNAHAPVPATEEVMQNLPRSVLEKGSTLLGRDCAVCKEEFRTDAEDADELVVVTLPCQHPFHESCIMPWLKSSGTCPVCRYQLVPQPDSHAPGPGPPGGSAPSPENPRRRSGSGGGSSGTNFLSSFFGGLGGSGSSGSSGTGNSSSSNNNNNQGSSRNNQSSSRRQHQDSIPGGWDEPMELD
ncbi:hypothetical protein WOLCODRAFT_22530 [Wolfiporia cocos MD-104 SS10]|uniref:RING-type domain-containing protein n=1 Tax=Wolfiporia cocos (strain MD-104) TaxID=742152 RepID=A0A2H3JE02_WOLCO|nr:hypothetical protein WOLCODRAFT_22530 [Wolfiporia cocos MD-104 SS10]